MISIERVKVKELCEFASGFAKVRNGNGVTPVAIHRALAHANNPYASQEDVALVVALKGAECAGYFGLLPGLLRDGDALYKVHWGSTYYVTDAFRGKGVGRRLLENVLALGEDIIVTRMTEGAQGVLNHFGFRSCGPLRYYHLRVDKVSLRDVVNLVLPMHSGFAGQSAGRILGRPAVVGRGGHAFLKKLFYSLFLRSMEDTAGGLRYRMVGSVRESPCGSAEPTDSGPEFYRGAEVVNWMLHYRWVLSGQKAAGPKYHFSDFLDLFQYLPVEIQSSEGDSYKGYCVLSVSRTSRRTILKVLDFCLRDPSALEFAVGITMSFARKYGADRIELPSPFASRLEGRHSVDRLLKTKERTYLYHPKSGESPLAASAARILLKYCDGDAAFV